MATRTYSVLSTLDLANPLWTPLTNITAGDLERVILIPASTTGQAAFYRLVTPAQP
jgi:hypothetical protein